MRLDFLDLALIRLIFAGKEVIFGPGRPLYLPKHVQANQFLSAFVNNNHHGCLKTINKNYIEVSDFMDIISYFLFP